MNMKAMSPMDIWMKGTMGSDLPEKHDGKVESVVEKGIQDVYVKNGLKDTEVVKDIKDAYRYCQEGKLPLGWKKDNNCIESPTIGDPYSHHTSQFIEFKKDDKNTIVTLSSSNVHDHQRIKAQFDKNGNLIKDSIEEQWLMCD